MMVVLFGSAAVAFQDGTGRRIADACQAFAQFAAGLAIGKLRLTTIMITWRRRKGPIVLCARPMLA
jgi:hypothetical protein